MDWIQPESSWRGSKQIHSSHGKTAVSVYSFYKFWWIFPNKSRFRKASAQKKSNQARYFRLYTEGTTWKNFTTLPWNFKNSADLPYKRNPARACSKRHWICCSSKFFIRPGIFYKPVLRNKNFPVAYTNPHRQPEFPTSTEPSAPCSISAKKNKWHCSITKYAANRWQPATHGSCPDT